MDVIYEAFAVEGDGVTNGDALTSTCSCQTDTEEKHRLMLSTVLLDKLHVFCVISGGKRKKTHISFSLLTHVELFFSFKRCRLFTSFNLVHFMQQGVEILMKMKHFCCKGSLCVLHDEMSRWSNTNKSESDKFDRLAVKTRQTEYPFSKHSWLVGAPLHLFVF